ncbi:MAG: CopG family transcriptional regulator [Aquabacterium sp.]
MSNTTVCIEDNMTARIAAAAERAGTTVQALILGAIEQAVEQAEQEALIHEVADARLPRLLATGKTVAWGEAKSYVAARARGEHPDKPKARKPTAA